jgi:hypothetical protein
MAAYTRTNKGLGFNQNAGKNGLVYRLIIKGGCVVGREQLTGRGKGQREYYREPFEKIESYKAG